MTAGPTTIGASSQRGSLLYIKDETEYYPHQIEGIRELARRTNFILADEMGLGKSLEAITVAAIDFERGWASRVLVVCPASLKENWMDELRKFTRFKGMVLSNLPPKVRLAELEDFSRGDFQFLIVNYEQVVAHVDDLVAMNFTIVIYDEAHSIKNPKSKRTKACLALRSERSFMLTGSPLLNQVNELWTLMHKCNPAMYPNYWQFVNRYAVFGGYKDKQIVGVKNQKELTERLDGVMLRRLKKDVLGLPEKQRIIVKVDLSETQKALYKQAAEEAKIENPSGATPMEVENAMARMLRLKQICGTPAALGYNDKLGLVHTDSYPDDSIKLDRAMEITTELVRDNGHKFVVFTQFRGVLAAYAARAAALGLPVWALHGDVPIPDRIPTVTAWGNTKEPGVLLCMLQVAGVGLNMTAAGRAMFLDKLWVPKLNEQAEDRLHRIGASETQPVQIYEMICRKTIEERIEMILRRKTKLFKDVVETSDWKRALLEALSEDEDNEE